MKMETHDNVKETEEVVSGGLRIPALRFCGQVARWTGNSTSNQNEVGISDTFVFEAPTGEIASAHLELHNVGSTAIFYSWQQIHVPHLQLLSQQKGHYFYFNRSPDVILPGDTKHVEFTFKSELAGIKTEIWQLNTHPVLLQGASMQVKLKGYAVYQDKNADEKLLLEKMLEKEMTHKMCQSIVYKMLQGVHTPERPSSPAELYITEEEDFVRKNPKWQYFEKPVRELKRLWHEVNPGHTWDLSVETLRQAILALPLQQSVHDTVTREEGLRQLNSFLLGLSEPYELKYNHPTPDIMGQQLWRNLLDTMDDEATRLRQVLGLPVNETWVDKEYPMPDADLAENINKDDKPSKKEGAAAKEERNVVKYRLKDDNKGESKTAATEKTVEVKVKKKGEKKDEVGKGKGKQTQERESVLASQALSDNIRKETPKDEHEDPDRINIYKQFLHKTVYALMEDLVDTFCDLMDEGQALDINTRQ